LHTSIKEVKKLSLNSTMKEQNFHCLLAIAVLIMAVKSAYVLPDAPKAAAQLYYDSISPERRVDFIRYFLAEGLMEQGIFVKAQKLAAIDPIEEFGEPPTGFATDLLTWYRLELNMSDYDLKEVVENTVDKILGSCTDPSDIGCHCCPFGRWQNVS